MAGRRYTIIRRRETLDRDGYVRLASRCNLAKPAERWRAYLACEQATTKAGDVDGWLWGAGFTQALAGHAQPEAGIEAAEGWRAAAVLIREAGVAVEWEPPMTDGCSTFATASERTREAARGAVLARMPP